LESCGGLLSQLSLFHFCILNYLLELTPGIIHQGLPFGKVHFILFLAVFMFSGGIAYVGGCIVVVVVDDDKACHSDLP
jgi:hypothetical protein